jgi:hypothetical protein
MRKRPIKLLGIKDKNMNNQDKRQVSIRQKDNTGLSYKNTLIKEDFDFFLYQKNQKISSALFLVTAHLDDSNILKDSIRLVALSLIKDTNFNLKESDEKNIPFVFYSNVENNFSTNSYKKSIASLIKIKSFLLIGTESFLLNQNNSEILINVIDDLLAEISAHIFTTNDAQDSTSSTLFTEDYFSVLGTYDNNLLKNEDRNNGSDVDKNNDVEEMRSVKKDTTLDLPKKNFASVGNVVKSKNNFGNTSDIKTVHSATKATAGKEGKSIRQEKILSIIKDKKLVGIKDISKNITDCSEKTIQRELIAMLDGGLIKKEGERRWSLYSMA